MLNVNMLFFLIQAKDENVKAMWEDGHFYRERVVENSNEGNQKDNNCLVRPPPPFGFFFYFAN